MSVVYLILSYFSIVRLPILILNILLLNFDVRRHRRPVQKDAVVVVVVVVVVVLLEWLLRVSLGRRMPMLILPLCDLSKCVMGYTL